MNIPNYDEILKTYEIIKPFIKKTPVLTSESINNIFNNRFFFKCEIFQKGGAFKFRGVNSALEKLSPEKAKNGVATHSSGNHAQALALGAKIRNIKSYIVMPENSSRVKIEAVKSYNGNIIYCEKSLESRETTLKKVIEETGATLIHAFDNYDVICGQATAAMELIQEVGDLDYIICPVGGGGLLSGTLLSTKHLLPNCKVIAAEPEGANDTEQSINTGQFVPSIEPNTICDGLRTSLAPITYHIISKYIDEVLTASDESVIKAMRLMAERMKIVVEPSAAVTLALLIEEKLKIENKKIGIILSGGNIDYNEFVKYL